MEEATTQEMTFGEKVVGKTFNPSGDDKVARLKQLAAEMVDIVEQDYSKKPITPIGDILFQQAVGEILNGQMNAVKFVTNKY